jgi:hypothetical protein
MGATVKQNVLLDELRAAFPPVPLVAAGAFEQRGRFYCDAAEYRRQMDGKTWEQLEPQFFARRSDGLSFLGTPYIVAVLPLYLHLLLALKPTSPGPETLLPQLTRPAPTDPPARLFEELAMRFDELTQALTDHQRRVVVATLRQFIAAAPGEAAPAQRALDRYWHVFGAIEPARS